MKRTRLIIMIAVAAMSLLTVGCKEKLVIREFGGEMEQLGSDEKNYLGHHEQWIYWENGDNIRVGIEGSSTTAICDLVSGHQSMTGRFKSRSGMPSEVAPLFAIYPAKSYGASYTDLIFPQEMPYRANDAATHPDSSFGTGCMPMVAYEDDGSDSTIYFHTVCGILRLQFYSSTGEKTIESIEFNTTTEDGWGTNQQISGHFGVNNITTNQPYLTPSGSADDNTETPPAAPNKQVLKITNINQKISENKLLTFYLPMPAIGSESTTTQYDMWMTVKTSDSKQCRKKLSAYIHRRNITMMPALDLTSFVSSGNGTATGTLVGSGTKDRPFQIYSGSDLELVRVALKNGTTLNGQTIKGMTESGGPTYFKIVRSDIILVASQTAFNALTAAQQKQAVVWNQGGIENFKGYMYFSSSTSTDGTIINNSGNPLFKSISSDGKVEGVYVSGTQTIYGSGAYSPFCTENNGEIRNCQNLCNVSSSTGRTLAGLCCENNGTIYGGGNQGSLSSTGGSVAGICANNMSGAEIEGSFALSVAVPSGDQVGGLCFHNEGTIKNCQVSVSLSPLNSTGNWGVIVYENDGGEVDNCRCIGSVVITTTGSIGGICHTMIDGVVKNCVNDVTLSGASGNVGGIVGEMQAGEVFNSYATGPHGIYGTASSVPGVKADNAGGIVGHLQGGAVRNCYARSLVQGATNSGGLLGNIDDGAIVENCYSSRSTVKFLGATAATDSVGGYCFSGYPADKLIGCSIIANTNIIEGGVATHGVLVTDAQTDVESYEGHYLYEALNAWVTAQGEGKPYKAWSTDKGDNVYPMFAGDSKKSKARRGRR